MKKYTMYYLSLSVSDETIQPSITSDNSLTPLTDYLGRKVRLFKTI